MVRFTADLRQAARSLTRRPVFAATVVLVLSLGIGLDTTVFSVIEGVLLRDLPYPRADRIVELAQRLPVTVGHGASGFLLSDLRPFREECDAFAAVAATMSRSWTLTGEDEPLRLTGAAVSPALFTVLGVGAERGRTFTAEEETPGNDRVVLLSHRSWTSTLAGDPQIVGRTLTLDGQPHTVVGVMPKDFAYPDRGTELWLPLALGTESAGVPPEARIEINVPVIGRLAEGVSVESARRRGQAALARLHGDDSEGEEQPEMVLTPLLEREVAGVRPALRLLAASVGLVLLVACVNVANLLLARGATRRREIAVRAVLGAGRRHLVRQLLAESVLLTGGATVGGVVLSALGIHLVRLLRPGGLPRTHEVTLDGHVLLFALGLGIVTCTLFALVPALQAGGLDPMTCLRGGSDAASSPRGARSRGVLVVLEVAAAVVLLVGGGLLAQSFLHLVRVDPGYQAAGLLTAKVDLPAWRYAQPESRLAFFRQVEEDATSLPGVTAAGLVNLLPLFPGRIVVGFGIEGRPRPSRREEVPMAELRLASPGYFQAMGIRLLQGRSIELGDRADRPSVAVIDHPLTGRYFPDGHPLGERTDFGTIVGVVSAVRYHHLDTEPEPTIYLPLGQAPPFMLAHQSTMNLVLRTQGDPTEVVPALRSVVRRLDPDLPLFDVAPMEQRLAESVEAPRTWASVLGLFALLALLLAGVGLYGLISYRVSLRTREIGVRMALGARSRDVSRAVLGEGGRLVLAGLILGGAGSLALRGLLQGLLFGVEVSDPGTLLAVIGALAGVGVSACAVPAARAARLDPSEALRDRW